MPTDQTTALLEDLRRLVEIESPSSDLTACHRCGDELATLLEERLDGQAAVGDDGRVTWSGGPGGQRPVLILGHLDTVWPTGTIDRLPFDVQRGRVTGPGVFDMKGGLVVAIHALSRLRRADRLPPVRLLVTTDEETGSERSRVQIEEEAARCRRVLVPEPCGPDGAVKTARKGVALGHLVVHGRASHSGLAPEEGINAAVALGPLLPAVAGLGDTNRGTTVVPTLVTAGTAVNTVPARAEARIDVRFLVPGEVDRVRDALTAIARRGEQDAPVGPVEIEAYLEMNRPALTADASAPLLPALRDASRSVGQHVAEVQVGGASDANIAASVGAAVLDGLGPPGDGAHADHEHVRVEGLLERVALLTELVPRAASVAVDG